MVLMGGTLFSDADAQYRDSRYVIFGAPLDISGTHRKGTGEAPQAIRRESFNFESFMFDLEVELAHVPTHDLGDLPMESPKEDIVKAVEEILDGHRVPVMLGGEHSVSPYAVAGFRDISVLVFDAHLDYREEYEGDRNSHACATRRMGEALEGKPILPVGIRSVFGPEYEDAKRDGLEYVTADRVRALGPRELMTLIDEKLPGKLYISVDMDGIDPAYAPGVGTPEPFGLDPVTVRDIIRHVAHRTVGYDMVEVCPPADNGNTAALAAKFIKDFIAAREKGLQRF